MQTEFFKELEAKYAIKVMSEESRMRLIDMCEKSLLCFSSVAIECKREDDCVKDLRGIFSLLAIESSLRHHALVADSTNDRVIELAHRCASYTIKQWARNFERELTLEENIELWKMQKL